MRTFLYALAVVSLTILAACYSSDSRGSVQRGQDRRPGERQSLAVAPALRFQPRSKIEIQIDIENTSGEPLRYLLGNNAFASDGGGMGELEFALYSDRRLVRQRETGRLPAAAPDMVRTLKPRDRVRYPLRISERYGELVPGKYEVIARYDVPPSSSLVTELGLSPLSFERTVMYFEVEK